MSRMSLAQSRSNQLPVLPVADHRVGIEVAGTGSSIDLMEAA